MKRILRERGKLDAIVPEDSSITELVYEIMGYEAKDPPHIEGRLNLCQVFLTQDMKDKHEEFEPGLMKDEDVDHYGATVVILLTSVDRDFETDYNQNVIEKITRVSQEIFDGRKPYWWRAGDVLMSIDSLRTNPSHTVDSVDSVDRGVASLKLV